MKGKIDINGHLYLERAGVLKGQFCHYARLLVFCSDKCPLFGEPYAAEIGYLDGRDGEQRIILSLCKREWSFVDFEDKR